MNTVQKLEDVEIQKEKVPAGEFLSHLRETADFLCQSKDLACEFESSVTTETILIDPSAVTQIFENLLGNALRFAKSKICIVCSSDENTFSVSVADDGKGFGDKELMTAAKPYYNGQAEKGQFHFGLGLHICRTLCEKPADRCGLKTQTGMVRRLRPFSQPTNYERAVLMY
jgi:signal transduction histidine kinase